jgi:hypothetical protein
MGNHISRSSSNGASAAQTEHAPLVPLATTSTTNAKSNNDSHEPTVGYGSSDKTTTTKVPAMTMSGSLVRQLTDHVKNAVAQHTGTIRTRAVLPMTECRHTRSKSNCVWSMIPSHSRFSFKLLLHCRLHWISWFHVDCCQLTHWARHVEFARYVCEIRCHSNCTVHTLCLRSIGSLLHAHGQYDQ